MNPRSSLDGLLLFPDESEVWASLDKATQEEVLDCLALLLLRHLQHCAANEQASAQGRTA
jgi:hypothetical protein